MNDSPRDSDSAGTNDPGGAADARFAAAAGQHLRAQADELDAATRSRLNQARQRALDQLPGRSRPRPGWLPAAAVTAAAAGLAVAVLLEPRGGPAPAPGPASVAAAPADFELLLAADTADDLTMLEDLEFYAWLDASRSDAELNAELAAALDAVS